MAKFLTVYDAKGTERTVRAVDAKEIVEAGGSYEKPEAKAGKVPDADGPATEQMFSDDFPGAAVFIDQGISYQTVSTMSHDELIAIKGIGPATAEQILAIRSE